MLAKKQEYFLFITLNALHGKGYKKRGVVYDDSLKMKFGCLGKTNIHQGYIIG